jgi:hypothetical protein
MIRDSYKDSQDKEYRSAGCGRARPILSPPERCRSSFERVLDGEWGSREPSALKSCPGEDHRLEEDQDDISNRASYRRVPRMPYSHISLIWEVDGP